MQHQRIEPGPGQESVWDYPRPPRLESCQKKVQIVVSDTVIVDSKNCFRVLETSHPPVYYLDPQTIRMDLLHESEHGSFCEWKGQASYYSLKLQNHTIENAAWCYKRPTRRFEAIAGFLAFYPSKMDQCLVDGERVVSQEGDFYGGWITHDIVGPFKGGQGTRGW